MWQEIGKVTSEVSVLRRLLFGAVHIPDSTPNRWDIISDFAFQHSTRKCASTDVKLLLENVEFLDREAFATDTVLASELLSVKRPNGEPLGVVLISPNTICKLCGGTLLTRVDRPSRVTIYSETMGTVPATHFYKYCQNSRKGCSFTQHYSYSTEGEGSESMYDEDWQTLPFFVSTHKTAFEMQFLKRLDAEILIGQITYNQSCDIYNYMHRYGASCEANEDTARGSEDNESTPGTPSELCDRARLDYRRLEDAHLKFCVMNVYSMYPSAFPSKNIASNVQHTIDSITPSFYRAFEEKYAAHSCRYPGCGTAFVLDGNQKNRRDVCAATHAGEIEYEGLPGSIRSGCQLSPMYRSKYCFHHSPRVVKSCEPLSSSGEDGTSDRESVVRFITGKRSTRSGVTYQVAWFGVEEKITWEPASTLPQNLVDEFESGCTAEEVLHDSRYGVRSHTIIVPARQSEETPPAKKLKRTQWEKGAFTEAQDDLADPLSCNTEKDKGSQRKTERTAGVLVGMWPCGIILLVAELFRSESKSQVYASIHEFLRRNTKVSSNLKYICYDDGCHLRRYAQNPVRRDLTECTKMISQLEIVIDKLHMAGHTDKWCKEVCDPHKFRDLDKVDTEICEQCFSWLSRYARMTRRMSRNTFIFFMLYICDLHNTKVIMKLKARRYID